MEKEENAVEEHEFYAAAAKYWEHVPPTIDGMLGGFGFISQIDIKGSNKFLKDLFESKTPPSKTYALDCGAGIGRITKNLLLNHFKHVDLVEQNSNFLEVAKSCLKSYASRIGNYYPTGLQNFCFATKKYDVIWCQWVLSHLKHDDLIEFFKKCSMGLRCNGLIIVKENVTSSENLEIDTKDSSVTRPLSEFHHIFQESNLVCIKEEQQHKFPRGLYPVYMFALRPNI
ncbi:N-terminal Xaa-Pro-Lys N-methyltransferase 1 isoform X1 [Ceratina calcarata]|uniref:Alpha N-terminal protein methyltransferase 1 n=2 Tax=Ceratina calcarata TaxID=156304 RepID=A0AAJ7S0H1_9HYME|nr:N-terminal Xaa-Pro-Lys N-methyltransferase 1 isoform X1 [Ceratina calcarata]XP_017878266.1 N-terminal Xaa-Pro-Lys N-methyltransferase 1 isoform X1 [Ceratina calcarata]XP_026668507.1 N-terminal Xaa-Pro-Lys N-methyltransferase 1 isoform X1 [Ceratina calcarata]XP_026668508.1 N-terminal Xaa-Pro-Lys N-methyltransferase 1 isoform X1 [Ceratina calcarata]